MYVFWTYVKKGLLTLSILAVSLFISKSKSYATSSEGPTLPPKGKAETGYEYNLIYKRSLDRSYGNLKAESHFYTVSLGIFEWLTLDGKIGLGNVRQKGGIHLPKLEYKLGFAGGYGLRIKLFDYANTKTRIIIGAHHISIHPQDRSIGDDKYESFLDDWQVSCLISNRFKLLTPYIGMKLSDCEIVYNINKHDKKRRYSRNHIGFICGSDLHLIKDKAKVNVEARFFDEAAFSAKITYLF